MRSVKIPVSVNFIISSIWLTVIDGSLITTNDMSYFRTNNMDAPSFIRISRMFMDAAESNNILEELAVLMPDIERQNALYKGLGQPPNLIPCSQCRQVLKRNELAHHTGLHSLSIDPHGLRTKIHHDV